MNIHKLINDLKSKYGDQYYEQIIDLIIHFSKQYKSKSDVILNLRSDIDFSFKKIDKTLNKIIKKKIPIEHIIKKIKFLDLDLYVNKNVLIPRKETEFIVEKIIGEFDNKDLNILDICCGSGNIGLSLKKHNNHWNVMMIDKYIWPVLISKYNAKKNDLSVSIIRKNLLKYKPSLKFDLIITNPPYVSNDYKLDDFVKKEPKQALFANDNGLFYVKKIIDKYYDFLKSNGIMIIEFGFDQEDAINQYLNGKLNYEFIEDQFGIRRFIKIRKDK